MKRILIESPLAGDVEINLLYLRFCLRDCFARGEAPFASHGLYPGALDDDDPAQRELGIAAGLEWGACAHATAVYVDIGVSRGMQYGIENARKAGRPIETRHLSGKAWGEFVEKRHAIVQARLKKEKPTC